MSLVWFSFLSLSEHSSRWVKFPGPHMTQEVCYLILEHSLSCISCCLHCWSQQNGRACPRGTREHTWLSEDCIHPECTGTGITHSCECTHRRQLALAALQCWWGIALWSMELAVSDSWFCHGKGSSGSLLCSLEFWMLVQRRQWAVGACV